MRVDRDKCEDTLVLSDGDEMGITWFFFFFQAEDGIRDRDG